MTTASTLVAQRFTVQPYTAHCRVIAGEGAHAVIGISSGNSYFTHDRVRSLAVWALAHFEQVDLVYTDLHVADMYTALGYTPEQARRKSVKNLRGVRAKVAAAVAEADPCGGRLRGQAMSSLADRPAYRALHDQVLTALREDDEAAATCDRLAGMFLAGKLTAGEGITAEQRHACWNYVAAEVPLFLDSPAVFGVPSSLNCYHQALPLADLLYARGPGLRASRNQGHGIVTPKDAS